MSRPSPLLRVTRAVTAIITLWCLGCSGFEPLLEAALGLEGAVMTCGGAGVSTASSMSAGASERSLQQAAVSAAGATRRDFDCGCGSCHAAAPSVQRVAAVASPAPVSTPGSRTMPASIVRAPLLPPPQLAT